MLGAAIVRSGYQYNLVKDSPFIYDVDSCERKDQQKSCGCNQPHQYFLSDDYAVGLTDGPAEIVFRYSRDDLP